MAIVLTDSANYSDIADAIREKNGSTDTYKPSEMAAAISAIESGGSRPIDAGTVERIYSAYGVSKTSFPYLFVIQSMYTSARNTPYTYVYFSKFASKTATSVFLGGSYKTGRVYEKPLFTTKNELIENIITSPITLSSGTSSAENGFLASGESDSLIHFALTNDTSDLVGKWEYI